jgi:hypothetical protein
MMSGAWERVSKKGCYQGRASRGELNFCWVEGDRVVSVGPWVWSGFGKLSCRENRALCAK